MQSNQRQIHPIGSRTLASSLIKQVMLFFCLIPAGVTAKPFVNTAAETVTLQLKYYHQFQFAGYYAALEKGFYKEAGLDVKLKANEPGLKSPIDEVLSGAAQYGVADNTLVIERLAGKPVVVLANIFQKSPAVWIVLEDSGISGLHDLVGKRVMQNTGLTSEMLAALQVEGIPASKINLIPSSFNIQDLIDGHTDAFNGYSVNEPYILREQGIAYRLISPRNYGIEFYGDVLFTSESEINDHPERAKAFRLASLKGWRYAMDHPEEIIDIIRTKYTSNKSRSHLKFEAEAMRELILPNLVSIGHINPGRWRVIAERFSALGLTEANDDLLEGFIYDPIPKTQDLTKLYVVIMLVALLALLFLSLAIWIWRLNTRLKKSERGLNEAQGIAHIASWEWGVNDNVIYWSDEQYKMFGLEPNEIDPNYDYYLNSIHKDDQANVLEQLDKAMTGEDNYSAEFRLIKKDGEERVVHAQGIVARDKDGNPERIIGTTQDITERKNTEDAIRESEQRLNEAQAVARLASWEVNLIDGVIKWSDEQYRMLGLEPGQIAPNYDYFFNAVHKDDRDANKTALDKALSGEADYHIECRLIKEGGEEIIVISNGIVERDNDGNPVRMFGTTQDITERKKIDEALRKSEERYRSIVQQQTELICRFQPDFTLTFINNAYCKYFKKSESDLLGQNFLSLIPEEAWDSVRQHFASFTQERNVQTQEHTVITSDGSKRWQQWTNQSFFDESGKLLEFQAVGRDITDLKELESQLRHSQKMEAIGTLTGGIAHEFNNLLTPILGFTELTLFNDSISDLTKKNLNQVQLAGQRAQKLIKQMLAYSRQSHSQRVSVNLETVLDDVIQLIKNTIPSNILVTKEIATSLVPIIGMQDEIHQVILNLCLNACHAMPEGGVLTVALQKENSYKFIDSEGQGQVGDFIRISIQDTGTGIEPENSDKIFDPFFTTKEVGKGSGLGLSVAEGIVEQHHGHIELETTIGKGTTFHIYLPIAYEEETKQSEKTTTELQLGNEKVFIIDNEAMVNNLTKSMLERLGYKVTDFLDCDEALKVFKESPQDFDLVITDYEMPKMNGKQFSKKIKEMRTDIPIILLTGYGQLVAKEDIEEWGINDLMLKPFNLEKLSNKVRAVLDK